MRTSTRQLAALTTAVAMAVLALTPAPDSSAVSPSPTLPLGDADLVETRTTETLAPGVRLIRIVRGSEPAPEGEINSTTRGPWRVSVLRINPARARGHLAATHGPDLANVEPTTDLVRGSGALAGVNASFFMLGAQHPGDPQGLGLYAGQLLSEPTLAPAEVDLMVDAETNQVRIERLGWFGMMRNRSSGVRLALESLNSTPAVPRRCAEQVDQTSCDADGDLVRFTRAFAASTPSGYGVEVVLGKQGCVVRRAQTRGTTLTSSQTALQATGSDTTALLRATRSGCLDARLHLSDSSGQRLQTDANTFGVNGRHRLTSGGQVVAPTGTGSFFERNPRTIAGTTAQGVVVLATIDGRQSSSVGTSIEETAAVADSLGMHESVNLDGGGSSAMSVGGELVSRPSDPTGERAVGDALVYIE